MRSSREQTTRFAPCFTPVAAALLAAVLIWCSATIVHGEHHHSDLTPCVVCALGSSSGEAPIVVTEFDLPSHYVELAPLVERIPTPSRLVASERGPPTPHA